jgi:hypothetical protein
MNDDDKNCPLITTDEGLKLSELALEASNTVIHGSNGPYDAAVLLASFVGAFGMSFSEYHWDAIRSIALTEKDGENYKKVSNLILAIDEVRTAGNKVVLKAIQDGVLDKDGNLCNK